ncbi:40S ribosomal protein S5-1 [Hordeum vulgare]|nr:40S ribosomal protein S5-1 [Hordeum vulgare]
MTSPNPSKDKFFEKVINPYLAVVMKNLQAIEIHEGVLHIRDDQGSKKEGSDKARTPETKFYFYDEESTP